MRKNYEYTYEYTRWYCICNVCVLRFDFFRSFYNLYFFRLLLFVAVLQIYAYYISTYVRIPWESFAFTQRKKRIVEGHPTKEELLSMFVRPFPTLNCIQIIFSNLECQSFMVRITNQHSLSFLCTSYMFIFDISHFCAFVS